jgi:hypothetical protein
MNRILDIYFVGGFGTVQVRGVGLGRCRHIVGAYSCWAPPPHADQPRSAFAVAPARLLQWVDVEEYSRVQPDSIVMSNPNQTLQVLNEAYSGAARGKGRQGRAGGMIRRQSRRMLRAGTRLYCACVH